MSEIIASISKHVIPFSYQGDFDTFLLRFSDSSLYEICTNLVSDDIGLNDYIIHKFQSESNYCRKINLLPNHDDVLYTDHNTRRRITLSITGNQGDSPLEFAILNISFYVFSKNVGFLVTDFDILSKSISEAIKTNYFLKMIKSSKLQNIIFKKKIDKDSYESGEVNLKDFYSAILDRLGLCQVHRLPSEAHPFTALLCHSEYDQDDVGKTAAILSRGYKQSYKISKDEVKSTVLSGFDNMTLGTSLEGVSCFVSLTNDDNTNHFLTSNFFTKNGALNKIYFMIYLMLLNQRYTLLHINGDIERIFGRKMSEHVIEYAASLVRIKMAIAEIYVNHIHYDLSNNTNYKNYYNALRHSLNIDALLLDYHVKVSGLEQTEQILRLEYDIRIEDRENRIETAIRRIAKIGLIVAIIAFLPNFNTVVSEILSELSIETSSLPMMLILFIACLIGLALYELIIYCVKRKK